MSNHKPLMIEFAWRTFFIGIFVDTGADFPALLIIGLGPLGISIQRWPYWKSAISAYVVRRTATPPAAPRLSNEEGK